MTKFHYLEMFGSMPNEQDHLFTVPAITAVFGLLSVPGLGLALMALAFPQPNFLFWIGFAIAYAGAFGSIWVLIHEIKNKNKSRYVVLILTVVTLVIPNIVLTAALNRNATELAQLRNSKQIVWQMSPRERADLKVNLCPAAKKAGPVLVGSISDPLSGAYARQILEVLGSCGADVYNEWNPENRYQAPAPMDVWTHPSKTGIFIAVKDVSNPDPESIGLLDAFHQSGIDAEFLRNTGPYFPPAKEILIGPRP